MIRVMIVDDHAIVRKGIRALLTESGDFEICLLYTSRCV